MFGMGSRGKVFIIGVLEKKFVDSVDVGGYVGFRLVSELRF